MTDRSSSAGGSPTPESPTLALRLLGTGGALVVGLYLWPLLPALVVSAVAAALVVPLQRRAERHWFPPGLVAFLHTLAVFLLVLLPLTGLSILIGREAATGIRWLESEAPTLLGPGSRLEAVAQALLSRVGLSSVEFTPLVAQQLDQIASLMASRSVAFVSGLGGWLVQAGVALFTLYYLLRDAEAVQKAICWFVPLKEAQTRRLLARARDVTYATVVGNLLVAVVQGTLGGVAFWVVGLPSPALWGTVMGVLSLLPVIGAPVVWLPGALHLLSVGRLPQALGLLLFGFLVIGTVDNLLRAWLVSDRIHVHPLLVFLGVVGGIFIFGAVGMVVGPVGFVVALALMQMSREPLDGTAPDAPPDGSFFIELPDPGPPSGAGSHASKTPERIP